MNIIAHVNTLDKVLSRLAQSVERQTLKAVSYTHLTLPTILLV